jgi:hypothetical protein
VPVVFRYMCMGCFRRWFKQYTVPFELLYLFEAQGIGPQPMIVVPEGMAACCGEANEESN